MQGGETYAGRPKDLPGAIELLQLSADSGLDKPARALRRVLRHQREVEERRRILLASDEAARQAAEEAAAEDAIAEVEAATPSEIAMQRMQAAVAQRQRDLRERTGAGSYDDDDDAGSEYGGADGDEDAAALMDGYLGGAMGVMQSRSGRTHRRRQTKAPPGASRVHGPE